MGASWAAMVKVPHSLGMCRRTRQIPMEQARSPGTQVKHLSFRRAFVATPQVARRMQHLFRGGSVSIFEKFEKESAERNA